MFSIAMGLGFFLTLRYAVEQYTHRLRLEPDALVTVSYFGRLRVPYQNIRGIRYWISDSESDRLVVSIVTNERDIDLTERYAELNDIADRIRQRCPNAKIFDERKYAINGSKN